jgi:hypothetical protein
MNTPARQRGISLLFATIMLPVLIGIVGLAIDTTYMILAYQQLQVAADAAALAGATQLNTLLNPRPGTPVPPISSVYTAAENVANHNVAGYAYVVLRQNVPNDAGGDVVIGQYNPSTLAFTATLLNPNAVKVVARRDGNVSPPGPLALLFGPIFGVNTVSMNRQATAALNVAPSVLVLSPSAPQALNISGGASLSSPGSAVQVDSVAGNAASISGASSIQATGLNVVGNLSHLGTGTLPPIATGVSPVTDPLLTIPVPALGNNLGSINVTGGQLQVLTPGYYSGGITISGTGSVMLLPGNYVLGGAGLQVTGSGALTALQVMLYITGAGQLNLSSSGQILLTPDQSASGTYSGLVIFQDRSNAQPATINGPGTLAINGVIYLPAAAAALTGQGDTFGSELIANTLTIAGTGTVRFNSAGGPIPPVQQPTAYLAQ